MNINKSFTNTFTKSNSFTNSNTNTYTITSTNTNTNTNNPLIEMQSCKGFAKNHCQNRFNKIRGLLDFIQLMNPSTLPGGLCLPGRTPLNKMAWGVMGDRQSMNNIKRKSRKNITKKGE
jgi:hypothetical protein